MYLRVVDIYLGDLLDNGGLNVELEIYYLMYFHQVFFMFLKPPIKIEVFRIYFWMIHSIMSSML